MPTPWDCDSAQGTPELLAAQSRAELTSSRGGPSSAWKRPPVAVGRCLTRALILCLQDIEPDTPHRTYVCIHVYNSMDLHICTYIYIYICICTYIPMYAYFYMSLFIVIRVYVYACACIYVCMLVLSVCVCVCMYVCM